MGLFRKRNKADVPGPMQAREDAETTRINLEILDDLLSFISRATLQTNGVEQPPPVDPDPEKSNVDQERAIVTGQ